MAKHKVLKSKDILRALLREGFYIDRQSGSHVRLIHSERSELRVTIPIHTGDLPIGTLKSILRQAKMTMEQLEQLL